MAIPVLIIGRSASGKTYSIKGFKDCPERIGVIAVEKGRLSFDAEGKIKPAKIPDYKDSPNVQTPAQLSLARYSYIERAIGNAKRKTIILDDTQFLLANELFERSNEKGYDKYTQMAANFRGLIHFINDLPEEDKIVYFLHHSEDDGTGREKVKTIGRMLDEKLVVESCFDVVIFCKDRKFYTQANDISTAKTPEGMFDEVEIPNNLKLVDDRIREYWGLGGDGNGD